MFEHFVGVDVSKDKFNFCVTNSIGEKLKEGACDVTDEGFKKFFSIIRVFNGVAIGLESTATYHCPLLFALLAGNLSTYLITPLLVKNFARSCSLRTVKTDSVDAKTIALFLEKNYTELHPAVVTGKEGLRELSRLRESISKKFVASKTKLKQLLTSMFPELVRTYDIFTVSMLALLAELPSAAAFRKTSVRKITKILDSVVKGRKTTFDAEEIKELAKKSVGVSDPIFEEAVKYHVREIHFFSEELKNVEKQLIEAVNKYCGEEMEILTSTKGIGEVTAAQFLAEIGDIERFKSSGQLIAYAGTDPGISQSGTSLVRKHISKKGNSSLRRVVFLMALHVIKFNEVFKEYFYKKTQLENMNGKKAVVAVANKLLRCIFAMLKNKKLFSV